MGSLFGGGESKSTTNTTQSYSADPRIQQAGTQALGQAAAAAATPFNLPQAPVAGFSPLQQQAFNQYQAMQGLTQPFMNTAGNYYSQSAAPITAADVNQYYNPMADSVMAGLKDVYGQQNKQATADAIRTAGGVGADRIGVTQANLAKSQGLATGQTMSNLYQQALNAAQMQKQMAAGAGAGFSNLGTQSLAANLQETNALSGAGAQQQQLAQAQMMSPYNWLLQQAAYPYQQAQFLAGVTGGLAPAFGGTTNGVSTTVSQGAQPSIFSQVLGLGAAGAGIYGALNDGGGGGGVPGTIYNTPNGQISLGGPSGPTPFYASGGSVDGYDDGGVADDGDMPHIPGISGDANLAPIPYIPMEGHGGGPNAGSLDVINAAAAAGQKATQQQSSGLNLGNIASTAAKLAPLFLSRGGVPTYADGQDVPNPGADNDPDMPEYDPSRPITGKPIPNLGPWPFNSGHTVPGGGVVNEPGPLAGVFSGSAAASPGPAKAPFPTTQQPGIMPSPGLPAPMNPTPSPPPVVPRSMPKVAPRVAPAPVAVADNEPPEMPRGRLPYPDATSRDDGQRITRSPWMALIQAGAAMASTPGGIGVSIGKGIQAGAKALDDQRKELRSEEELNQKARTLYQQAKQHLDKYNKMTPYERGSLALRNRELDQEEAGVSGKPGKFTGADYDRAAKFIQSMYPGMPPERLQPLIDAEVARRRRMLAAGTSAAAAQPTGESAAAALPDPGPGNRVKGKWYIGPSGQPQQWLQ